MGSLCGGLNLRNLMLATRMHTFGDKKRTSSRFEQYTGLCRSLHIFCHPPFTYLFLFSRLRPSVGFHGSGCCPLRIGKGLDHSPSKGRFLKVAKSPCKGVITRFGLQNVKSTSNTRSEMFARATCNYEMRNCEMCNFAL